MQYTLKSARRILRASSNAYGQNELRDSINRAIQSLAGMKGWVHLRKILRFVSEGPHFALPQGYAGIVRACVNGRPTTVRAQDFRFIQSGPGELSHPPSGFCPVRASNIVDVGMKPVMCEPRAPFRVFATAACASRERDDGSSYTGSADARIVVRGFSPSGELVRVELVPAKESVYASDGTLVAGDGTTELTVPDTQIQTVTEVTLDGTDEYVTLYAEDPLTDVRWPIALYNPYIEAPEFRHYEIAGVPPNVPVELLLECRIDPVPLVEDTDVLPLNSINPVEWAIRGDWQMKAGETEAAQKYYGMAANWLNALETTEGTVQTSVVVNSVLGNSFGEISAESVNI